MYTVFAVQGPVVQSIVSLTVISAGFFKSSSTKSSMLIFFAEKR